jgi:hypothetical protein
MNEDTEHDNREAGRIGDSGEFNVPLENLRCSEVTLAMILDAAQRAVTCGWETDPILSMYCQPKPNKYQRRYARIGRRRKK